MSRLLMGLFAAAAALFSVLYLCYIDWWARPARQLPTDLGHAVSGQESRIGRLYVYDFWGNFIDHHHLWRLEANPEVVDLLAEGLGTQELGSAEEVPDAFWVQPPYWWKPRRQAKGRFFRSKDFVPDHRGPDGNHYLLVYDGEEGVVYAWVKNNF